jgi:hypothetical protein
MSSRPANEEILRRARRGLAPAPRLRAVGAVEGAARGTRALRPGSAPTVGPRLAPRPRAAEVAWATLVLAAPFLLWAYFLAATAPGALR